MRKKKTSRIRRSKVDSVKNRIHSVILSQKAERIFRELEKFRARGWLGRDVSKMLEEWLGNLSDNELYVQMYISEIKELQQERDKLERRMRELAIHIQNQRKKRPERALFQRGNDLV